MAQPTKNLTPYQIGAVAYYAGFRGNGLAWAIAVSHAENRGGDPNVVNTRGNTPAGSRDRGLWQINDHWHPDVSDAEAFNPSSAAKAAYKISHQGKNWSAWSTYPVAAGAFFPLGKQIAGRVEKDAKAGNLPAWVDIGTHLPDVPGPIKALNPLEYIKPIGKFFGYLTDARTWIRVLMIFGGAVGLILGGILLARDANIIPKPT